uniref:Uncharacterized protein n=1 Tax=viral metagenome TaxID=1070528 RepID=A0A6H2A4K5_9ZZZZ
MRKILLILAGCLLVPLYCVIYAVAFTAYWLRGPDPDLPDLAEYPCFAPHPSVPRVCLNELHPVRRRDCGHCPVRAQRIARLNAPAHVSTGGY